MLHTKFQPPSFKTGIQEHTDIHLLRLGKGKLGCLLDDDAAICWQMHLLIARQLYYNLWNEKL